MSRVTCLGCGFEGNERTVRMKLVEYPTQPTYGAEWRCLDVEACRRRQAEQQEKLDELEAIQ